MSEFEQEFNEVVGETQCLLELDEVDARMIFNAGVKAAKKSMQGEAVGYVNGCDKAPELSNGSATILYSEVLPGTPLYTHAPDSAAVIADLQAQVEALKVKAARWEKCKTMSKQWWLNAMEEAGLKGGRSLDEQIEAAISKGGE